MLHNFIIIYVLFVIKFSAKLIQIKFSVKGKSFTLNFLLTDIQLLTIR